MSDYYFTLLIIIINIASFRITMIIDYQMRWVNKQYLIASRKVIIMNYDEAFLDFERELPKNLMTMFFSFSKWKYRHFFKKNHPTLHAFSKFLEKKDKLSKDSKNDT